MLCAKSSSIINKIILITMEDIWEGQSSDVEQILDQLTRLL